MKTLFLATLLAAVAAPSAHAASFTFTETFGLGFYAGQAQAVTTTGSFDGDLAGTLITNLRNISVFANGIAFTGNGALVVAGMDDARGIWAPASPPLRWTGARTTSSSPIARSVIRTICRPITITTIPPAPCRTSRPGSAPAARSAISAIRPR